MEPPPRRHGERAPDRDPTTRVAVVVVLGFFVVLLFLLLRSCTAPVAVPADPAAPTDTSVGSPGPRLATPLHLAHAGRASRRGSAATSSRRARRGAATRRSSRGHSRLVTRGTRPPGEAVYALIFHESA
jgi:hypothetical protein